MKTHVRKKSTRGKRQAIVQQSEIMRRLAGEDQFAGHQGSQQDLPRSLETKINGFRNEGQPLAGKTRAFMENRFARNFNRVRVHDNAPAAFVARSLGARAFTLGQNIVFGAGEYSPESREGRHLLAHELTHTVQQGATQDAPVMKEGSIQRRITPPGTRPPVGVRPTLPRRIPSAPARIARRVPWRYFWRAVARRFALRGAIAATLTAADGPFPVGDLIAMGMAVATVIEIAVVLIV